MTTAANDRVRFTASGAVVRMQIEVYSEAGETLSDVKSRGNVFNWVLQDSTGQRVIDGSYLCVVTVTNLDGKVSRHIGFISVEGKQVSLRGARAAQLSAAQQQAVGPVEENAALTILPEGDTPAVTVVAHDGRDGQVTSTTGALTFRTGDVFAGKETERMRITEDGRVGIGTDDPKTMFDVAGAIRARGGIVFNDGTALTSAGRAGRVNGKGEIQLNAVGTGTQNFIAKWTETGGAGTLGDSAIRESASGNIGVGKDADPAYKLDIFAPAGVVPFRFTQNVLASSNPTLSLFSTTDGVIGQYAATTHNGSASFVMGATGGKNFGIFANNAFTTPQLFIKNNGNVGIGTTNPFRALTIGSSFDAAFTISPTEGAPNAGFIRFGDSTGWKLHFGRSRESSAGPLDSGTTGILMTIQDNGNVGVGTTTPQARLDVRGDIKLGAGDLFALGGEQNLRIIRGIIGTNGNIITGTGFHLARHDQTGIYDIIFDFPFIGLPSVTGSTDLFSDTDGEIQDPLTVQYSDLTIRSVRIWLFTSNTRESHPFSFIAIGPR
jgi:hypothetical protein